MFGPTSPRGHASRRGGLNLFLSNQADNPLILASGGVIVRLCGYLTEPPPPASAVGDDYGQPVDLPE